jgi:sulfur-oxidizing protein SoxZ
MSTPSKPRVRVPTTATKGELVEIKTLISHDMESGQRKDAAGKTIPRRIINSFTAAFDGKIFFEADWKPAISANPYQSFFYRAQQSGEFTFTWKDDDGTEVSATSKLTVA